MYQETKVAVLMKTMQRNSSAPSNSRTSQLLQALEYNGHCPGAGQGSCHWGVHRQGWPQSLVVQELLCLGKPLRGLCRENPLALDQFQSWYVTVAAYSSQLLFVYPLWYLLVNCSISLSLSFLRFIVCIPCRLLGNASNSSPQGNFGYFGNLRNSRTHRFWRC